jgi:hypothetical protein
MRHSVAGAWRHWFEFALGNQFCGSTNDPLLSADETDRVASAHARSQYAAYMRVIGPSPTLSSLLLALLSGPPALVSF